MLAANLSLLDIHVQHCFHDEYVGINSSTISSIHMYNVLYRYNY